MSSGMDAERIVFEAKLKRNMWPFECCEWVADQLGVAATPADFESPVAWLAILLERSTNPRQTFKWLLFALDDAPSGTFTDEDWRREHQSQAREYDQWSTDRAEGLGRREGKQK